MISVKKATVNLTNLLPDSQAQVLYFCKAVCRCAGGKVDGREKGTPLRHNFTSGSNCKSTCCRLCYAAHRSHTS